MIEIKGKWYKLEAKNKPVEVVTKNGSEEFDCQAVLIQNAGDVTCMLNGNWTLRPNGSLSIGSQDDINSYVDKIQFQFLDTPGTRRIEIWPLTVSLCECKKFC